MAQVRLRNCFSFCGRTWESREDVEETLGFLDAPSPEALPIQHMSTQEVCLPIQNLHPRKTPGFNGMDSKIVKALPSLTDR